MSTKTKMLFFFVCVVTTVTTFASDYGDYGSSGVGINEVRSIGKVVKGTVLATRPITIKVSAGYGAKAAGASIGAAIGGIVGRNASRDNYAVAALLGTVGGIIGTIAGDAIGSESREGIEMIVLIENTGQIITVAQELQGTPVPANGSSVFVATINSVTRVYPDNTAQPAQRAGIPM